MNITLVDILVKEFSLNAEDANRIINRIAIFQKRDRERKGEIILPIDDVKQGMEAVRAYKELLERHMRASPEVSTEDIVTVQEMRNLEFRLQEYIFAHT